MDAKLIIVGGKASKDKIALKLPTVIGRGREATLTVAHPMISRQHCELYEVDGLLMIRDMGSTNGTVVGDQRVKQAPLPPNAEFTVGPLTFRTEYKYKGDLKKLPAPVPAEPDAGTEAMPDFQALDEPMPFDLPPPDATEAGAPQDASFFDDILDESDSMPEPETDSLPEPSAPPDAEEDEEPEPTPPPTTPRPVQKPQPKLEPAEETVAETTEVTINEDTVEEAFDVSIEEEGVVEENFEQSIGKEEAVEEDLEESTGEDAVEGAFEESIEEEAAEELPLRPAAAEPSGAESEAAEESASELPDVEDPAPSAVEEELVEEVAMAEEPATEDEAVDWMGDSDTPVRPVAGTKKAAAAKKKEKKPSWLSTLIEGWKKKGEKKEQPAKPAKKAKGKKAAKAAAEPVAEEAPVEEEPAVPQQSAAEEKPTKKAAQPKPAKEPDFFAQAEEEAAAESPESGDPEGGFDDFLDSLK